MSGQIRALAAELCEVIDNEYSELRMTKTKLFEELEQERQALQAEYQTKFAELAEMEKEITRKGESLEKLEQLNLAFVGRDNDVLKLNVSGEMFQMKRKTLTAPFPDSFLAHLFSGRWDENIEKDAEGNYFLDLDPWGFGVLLTYFREKGMETPESPAVFPFVPREKRDSFLNLLEYLGLRAYLEVRDPADIDKTCSNSSWWRWRLSRRKSPSSPPSPQLASRASNATPTQERNTRNNRLYHPACTFTGTTVHLPDTRSESAAASVRGARGFSSGTHSWSVEVVIVSDTSYVGFVSDMWSNPHREIGRCFESWSVASSGQIFAQKRDIEHVEEFTNGTQLTFVANMDAKTVSVMINGRRFEDLFRDLPDVIYPAVSNSRAAATYTIRYQGEAQPSAESAEQLNDADPTNARGETQSESVE
eukprot:GEMP01029691.1.p1 GENE.GEMP01029691.1~~GEMP01029691.1.p1  ORF type:complete len:420 (+),score=84.30 GEMP01029691.1:218-1477(+)